MYPGKCDMLTNSLSELTAKLVPVLCRSKDNEARKLQRTMCETSNTGNLSFVCYIDRTLYGFRVI